MYKRLKQLYNEAILTHEQLASLKSTLPEDCEIEKTCGSYDLVMIGTTVNDELYRYYVGSYKVKNTTTKEWFLVYA